MVGWLDGLFVCLYENYLKFIFGRIDCVHVSFSDKEVRSLLGLYQPHTNLSSRVQVWWAWVYDFRSLNVPKMVELWFPPNMGSNFMFKHKLRLVDIEVGRLKSLMLGLA